jgi:hypothetical protein
MKNEHHNIQNIKEYFYTELSSGIRIIERNAKVIIDVPLTNIRTAGMVFGFVIMVIISLNVDFSFYFIPLLAAYVAILGFFWAELDLLNNVVLDLENNTLQVRSNNFVKRLLSRLLKWNNTFRFDDITRLNLSHDWGVNVLHRYYLIELVLRDDKKIKVFYTQKNDPAVKIINFLRNVIKSK